MVAFVSDEYVTSQNCTMEFRFAADVMRIPTVLAVVGTGNAWRQSVVSVIAGCRQPIVAARTKILRLQVDHFTRF